MIEADRKQPLEELPGEATLKCANTLLVSVLFIGSKGDGEILEHNPELSVGGVRVRQQPKVLHEVAG